MGIRWARFGITRLSRWCDTLFAKRTGGTMKNLDAPRQRADAGAPGVDRRMFLRMAGVATLGLTFLTEACTLAPPAAPATGGATQPAAAPATPATGGANPTAAASTSKSK